MSPKNISQIRLENDCKNIFSTTRMSISDGPGNGNTVMTGTKPPLCKRSPVRASDEIK